MTAQALRSRNWFGRQDLDGFVHRSWIKAEGFSDQMFDGRPVIGIGNTFSEQVVRKLATADRMLGEGNDVGVAEGQSEDVA